eukprot:8261160-Alexandrium_andersonii.AAC.1
MEVMLAGASGPPLWLSCRRAWTPLLLLAPARRRRPRGNLVHRLRQGKALVGEANVEHLPSTARCWHCGVEQDAVSMAGEGSGASGGFRR